MRQLLLQSATSVALATWATVHAQIAVGCFQNQIDSSVGAITKSYQDIYMSQGACANFCKGQGTAYAITMDGSTCHCANQPPLDSNRVEDAKCDKPCMGYPFEMCGGSSSKSLASVLLIGGSTGSPPTPSSSSSPSTSDSKDNTPTGSKNLSANSPGSSDSGPSAGAVVASTMAILGFAALFIFAVVFSKRRRQRLAQAAWTENMLLPSSLVHSSNDDELEGHDYTRSSPIYHSKKMSQHSMPSPPANMHFPPPVLHPRQSGPLHMHHPSYPPPMGPHYNNIRAPYQPFPMPPLLSQHQASYSHDPNYKEPVDSSFNRGPQAITDVHPNEFEEEEDRFHRRLSSRRQAPSVRTMSIRPDRSVRGSVDTSNSH
ncbi:hypothetical protein BG005_009740 [Podila minutissima]|nr:hypothetical protein BG005_009740 [Podila minutissima]